LNYGKKDVQEKRGGGVFAFLAFFGFWGFFFFSILTFIILTF